MGLYGTSLAEPLTSASKADIHVCFYKDLQYSVSMLEKPICYLGTYLDI